MYIKLILIIFCLSLNGSAIAQNLVLVADKWCPYNCKPKDTKPGFIVEIAREVFARHDIHVKYEIMPWSRAIDMAKQGVVDGIIGATKDEVPDFIFPQFSQGASGTAFFVNPGETWRYDGMPSLQKIWLGVIQDYDYGEVMNRYIKARQGNGVDFVTGDNATQINIKKLYNKRLTAILEDPVVLSYQASVLNLKREFINAGNINTLEVYIAFAPKKQKASKRYAEILTDGMVWLRQTGQLQVILARYGLQDWVKKS